MNNTILIQILIGLIAGALIYKFYFKEQFSVVNQVDVPLSDFTPLTHNVEIEEIIAGDEKIDIDVLPVYTDAEEFVKNNKVSDILKDHNFLTASYHTSINGVMQNNRNQNQDLRTLPPVAK